MSVYQKFLSIDEVQRWAFSSLLTDGVSIAPRGMQTLEITPFGFTLINPRQRCVSAPERRWSLRLALGELSWHLSASDNAEFISYYAPRWREFSDDGHIIAGSAYGKTIFENGSRGASQWNSVLDLLRCDPGTRRAVLKFYSCGEEDILHSKDVSCTSTLQFLVGEGELSAHVCMRSNDAVWGLPYDVFFFTVLQEYMAFLLGVPIGQYHHTVGSFHIYDRHFELARRVLDAPSPPPFEMPPFSAPEEIPAFLHAERSLRLRKSAVQSPVLGPYWSDFLKVLALPREYKNADIDILTKAMKETPYGPVIAPYYIR